VAITPNANILGVILVISKSSRFDTLAAGRLLLLRQGYADLLRLRRGPTRFANPMARDAFSIACRTLQLLLSAR
jgi:hypothetical protein